MSYFFYWEVFLGGWWFWGFVLVFEKSYILPPPARDVLVNFTVGVLVCGLFFVFFFFGGTRMVGINIYSEDRLYDH